MSEERIEDARLAELRRRATLEEFTFTSTAPVVGGLVARLRDAWNSVATKWQMRPIMTQQSAFNQALVDWLARPPGTSALDTRLVANDRSQTRRARDIGLLTAEARRARSVVVDSHHSPKSNGRRLRLAYFSPLPPARSGIADYSAELLPHLAARADVTIFATDPLSAAIPGLEVRSAAEYELRRDEFDLPLYQMGNSEHHEATYDLLLRYPGVVVLHEVYLHHFVRHHTVGRGDWVGYGRELAYEMGSDGRRLGRAVRAEQADAPLFEVPLNQRVIDVALGLIVHSQYAADRIRRERPKALVGIASAPMEMRPGHSRRGDLALPDDAVLFGSYGQLTAEKQIEPALRAFRRAREAQPNAHYLLVGEAAPDVDVAALIADLGLNEVVHHVGYAGDLNSFVDWIHTADVVVNLRQPTAGETSAVALRALAAGRPLIVFDHGWYSELPDAVAVKIPPGDGDALQAAMERLAGLAELRRDMGQAALDYARHHCLPARTADAYVDFVHQVLAAGVAYA
jgi:glycosyltransferase involved in cell wall biosynthesis